MLKGGDKLFVLLICLAVIRGLIYIAIFPPWLAPDEATHFEAIRLIGQEGLWPTEEVYETTPMLPDMHASFQTFHIWQIAGLASPLGFLKQGDPSKDPYMYYYPAHNGGSVVIAGKYPLIYHLLLSPLAGLLKPLDIVQQLYIMRLSSLLLAVLTIGVGWFFGRTIFPEQKIVAVALASFLVFLPMYMHTNTSVNADVLTTLLVSLYFLVLAQIFCQQASIGRLVALSSLLVVAVLTKPTALFIIPTSVVAFIISLTRRFQWKPQILASLLALVAVLAGISAVTLFQLTEGGRGIATFSFSSVRFKLGVDYFNQISGADLLHIIRWSFISFWGLFGWADIPIPFSWVRVLWLVCTLIGVGIIIFLGEQIFDLRKGSRLKPQQKDILLILFFSLIFALVSLYTPIIATQSLTRWGAQSRYLFPALLPIALYFFLGFQQLLPSRVKPLALPIWLISLISFDSLVIFSFLLPSIYVI